MEKLCVLEAAVLAVRFRRDVRRIVYAGGEGIYIMARVFIGVGHGGSDTGTTGNGLIEKDVNLNMAIAMRDELIRNGVTVGISRTNDSGAGLREEIRKANEFGPDLAVEVHNNAGGGNGFEVYCQTNQFEKTSAALAKNIEAEIKAIGQNSRGLKTKINASGKDWFGWLRQVECPAVLCEGAFLDSSDSQIISTFEKQAQFGIAYAKGVLKQLGIAWKPDGSSGQNEPSPGTFKAGEEVTGKGTYYATADGTGSKGTTNGLTGKVYKTAYPKPYPVNINKIGWFQDRDVTLAAAGTGRFKTGDAVTGKGIYYAAADGTGSKGSTDGVIGKVYKTAYPNPYPVNIDKLGWFRDSDVKLSTQRDNPYSKPTRILRRGSEGSQVKWAQWALVNAGYGVGKYGVDGVFGEETEKAVRSFQKANGLSVDGEVGPDTVAKLA